MGQAQGTMDKKERKELKKLKKQELKAKKKLKKKKIKDNSGIREENALQALESIMVSAGNTLKNTDYEQSEKWAENQQTSAGNTSLFTSFIPEKTGYMTDTGMNSNYGQMEHADQNYQFNAYEKYNRGEFASDGRREFALIHADISEESSIIDEELVELSPLPPSPFQDRTGDALKEDVGIVTDGSSATSPLDKLDLDFSDSDGDSDSDTRTISEKHKEEVLEKSIAMKEDVKKESFENVAHEESTSPKEYEIDVKDRILDVDNDLKAEVIGLNELTADAQVENDGIKDECNGIKDECNGMKNECNGMKDVCNSLKEECNGLNDESYGTVNENYIMKEESSTNQLTNESKNQEILKKEKAQIHHEFRRSQPNTEILKNDYFQQLPDMYKLEIKDELMQQEIPNWYKNSKKNWSDRKKHGERHKNVTYNIGHHNKKDRVAKTNSVKNDMNSNLDKDIEGKNQLLAHSTPRLLDDTGSLCFTTNLSTIGLTKSQKHKLGENKHKSKKSKAINTLKPVKEVLTDSNQSFDKIADILNISKNSNNSESESEEHNLRDRRNIYKEDNNHGRHSKNRHTLRFLEDRNGKAKQQNRKSDDYFAERKNKTKREREIKQAKHILNIFSLKFHVFHNDSVSYMNKPSFLSLQKSYTFEL